MNSKTRPASALFFSGIHMDMLGTLEARALLGASNPGKFTTMPGGAGLNSASVASLLGLDCTIIGLVGDDAGGRALNLALQERKIGNLLTTHEHSVTGSYTSIIEPDGNLLIALADLSLNEEMSTQWLLETHAKPMAAADIWFLNANLATNTLLTLTNRNLAERPGTLAAASISPSKSQKLAPSLANLDVLFTNLAEANAMLENNKNNDAHDCITRFQQLGIAKGSLSQGAQILWVWDEHGVHRFTPPPHNRVVDVTGAGDALAGTFLAGLAQGKTMAQIAPLAIAAAQMVISVKGPFNAKINWPELNSRTQTRHNP